MNPEKMTKEQVELALKVGKEAQRMGINPDFVLPMVAAESGFDPNAISKKGAIGLMQLLPSTAKSLGVDPYDVDQNIQGGLQFIKQLSTMKNIGTNPVALLSAYNAGPGSKFLESGDPDQIPAETAAFVKRIEKYSGGQLRNPFIGTEDESEGAAQPGASQAGAAQAAGDGTTTAGNGSTTPASELDFQRLMFDLGGAGAGAAFSAGSQLTGAAGRKLVDALEGMSRIGQPSGTTPGAKWAEKITGYVKPGVETVSEAATDYRRAFPQAKIPSGPQKGKDAPSRRLAMRFGIPSPGEPTGLVDRLIAQGKVREELLNRQKSPLNMLKQAAASPLGKVGIGALGGLSAAEQAQAGLEKYAEQDIPMAAAYGLGAAGSALATIPYGPTQIAGGAMALSPMAMYLYRKATEKGEGKPSGLPSIYNPYFAP